MRSARTGLLTLLLAGSLTAACTATVVRPANISSHYGRSLVPSLARYGAVPTVVVGNPFDEPQSSVNSAVTEAIRGAHFGQELDFTTTPPAGIRSPYRLIVFFNPARTTRPERICSDLEQPTAQADGRLSVLMAICSTDTPLVWTFGSRPGVFGSADPGFRDLLRRTTSVLLPPRRYDINSPRNGARR